MPQRKIVLPQGYGAFLESAPVAGDIAAALSAVVNFRSWDDVPAEYRLEFALDRWFTELLGELAASSVYDEGLHRPSITVQISGLIMRSGVVDYPWTIYGSVVGKKHRLIWLVEFVYCPDKKQGYLAVNPKPVRY